MSNPYLKIKGLKTYFPLYEGVLFRRLKGTIRAVDNVNLEIEKSKILGLVGESGCGKSTLGRSIMRLVSITEGKIYLDNNEITALSGRKLNKIRPKFQMIFQDPYASLDPRMTIFDTLAEPILFHGFTDKNNLSNKISSLLEEVGLDPRFIKKYPHEFSGGQRQRIAIARALALEPELIIADEPVSALDVSIQSQILNLLLSLCKKRSLTIIFISHDLSVVRHIADTTAVMYLGKIVEYGNTEEIFRNPAHPYTRALLSAIPLTDPDKEKNQKRIILEGEPPSSVNPPKGCRFHPRCKYVTDECSEIEPDLVEIDNSHKAACIMMDEIRNAEKTSSKE